MTPTPTPEPEEEQPIVDAINRVEGTEGNDNPLLGTVGNDEIIGKDGDDVLIGGQGDDILTGGNGGDTFIFEPANGYDIITDFAGAMDAIAVTADLGFISSEQLFEAISPGDFLPGEPQFSVLHLSPDNQVKIFHNDPLTAANFSVMPPPVVLEEAVF
ncbi:MAG: hypothetical protein Fur0025_20600 [Oscillatoriaceae cyanobacterium]